jgi:hypothetical protein
VLLQAKGRRLSLPCAAPDNRPMDAELET